ncbi:MAG: NTP transferase domain-containing protein [Armatimonadetes bacterium]|nr:NTP transferase domain-containing protein [Armatimonadota bacterium]
MRLEAVLLTGGRVSRMSFHGCDYIVGGEPLAERMARLLATVVERVTVIGKRAVQGCSFLSDEGCEGTLSALAQFHPLARLVFVAACDMPLFDPGIVTFLEQRILADASANAVVPFVNGGSMPLCALYRSEAFSMIQTVVAEERHSLLSWTDTLWVERVEASALEEAGIDPEACVPVRTPEEFAAVSARLT